MPSPFDDFPAGYRSAEAGAIAAAVRAGECVSLVGLSGAGKSNLLGFLAARPPVPGQQFALVDCNRLPERSLPAFFRLAGRALGAPSRRAPADLEALDEIVERRLQEGPLCLLLDRFETLADDPDLGQIVPGNLRALRDAHKYRLTFVAATRRPLRAETEFAELFLAHTLWLGPLSKPDARWNVARYAQRQGLAWTEAQVETLIRLSGGYPSFLRAACEALAAGAPESGLAEHPAVQARLQEFWADHPSEEELHLAGLAGNPLAAAGRAPVFDSTQLTAKEHALLAYFQGRPGEVCEKDDLIRAVWPEDRVFEKGVRDDSLAQLVRRLREKIEPDASNPRYILTAPGRGYRFAPK